MNSNFTANTRQQAAGVTSMPTSKPVNLKVMFRLLATLLIVGLMGLIYFGYREWQAAQNLSGLLQKINAEDHEFSATSTANVPNRDEAVEAWSKVCVLSQNAMPGLRYLKKLPFIGQDTRVNFAAGQPWEEEPFVAETLEYLRPILDQLELAAEYPFPSPSSSQPGLYRPSDYNLFQFVIPILRLEINHAVYLKEHVRALSGLRLLLKIVQQPDNRIDIGNEIVLNTHHIAVLASLANAEWTENEIKELEQMLSSASNIDDKLKNGAIQTRRELADHFTAPRPSISGYPELETYFVNLPSHRHRTLAAADQLVRDIGEPGFRASMIKEASQIHKSSPLRNVLVTNALQFRHFVVPMFVNSEYARRLAITGLALKRFRMAHGKWPKQLSELKSMGLTERDYSTPGGEHFEYEVSALTKEELDHLHLSGPEEATREYAWIWIPGFESQGTRPSIQQAPKPTSALQSNDPGSQFPAYRIR